MAGDAEDASAGRVRSSASTSTPRWTPLSPGERDAAATIFQFLVTPAGTKIALGVEDLSPNTGMKPADLRSLLVKLAGGDSRILTTVAPAPDQPAVERYQIFTTCSRRRCPSGAAGM